MLITAEIPDEMVPWIADVFAAEFPDTADLAPSDAIKSVILSWVKVTLEGHEEARARREGDKLISDAVRGREAAVENARREARRATNRLVLSVDTTVTPPGAKTPPGIVSTGE